MNSEIKAQISFGPEITIHLIGGHSPYIWVGSDENNGFISDRSIRKLKRFCDHILAKKKKKTSKRNRVAG